MRLTWLGSADIWMVINIKTSQVRCASNRKSKPIIIHLYPRKGLALIDHLKGTISISAKYEALKRWRLPQVSNINRSYLPVIDHHSPFQSHRSHPREKFFIWSPWPKALLPLFPEVSANPTPFIASWLARHFQWQLISIVSWVMFWFWEHQSWEQKEHLSSHLSLQARSPSSPFFLWIIWAPK